MDIILLMALGNMFSVLIYLGEKTSLIVDYYFLGVYGIIFF